jgi:uncharacterized membrane protein YhaH (DUF805 family)
VLFSVIGVLVTAIIDRALRITVAYPLFGLATFLPGLAVAVRRLHDIDRTGWWILLALIPLVGAIVLIIWYCTKGTDGPNRFGPNPLPAAGA